MDNFFEAVEHVGHLCFHVHSSLALRDTVTILVLTVTQT